MGLKAVVRTPGVEGEEMEFEEIELPPQDMWPQLDNSGSGKPAESAPAVAAAPATVPIARADVAELQFVGPRSTRVTLEYPFNWEGARVDEISVRRLTLAEVETIARRRSSGNKMTTMDIYSVMTGLPATVLYGLDDDDGQRLTDVAFGFLPRSLRPEGG